MKYISSTVGRNFSFVILFVIFFSCKKEDDEYTLNNPDGLSIESILFFKKIDSLTVEADGITKNTVSIQVNPEAALSNREVSLVITSGKFSNGRQTDTVVPNAIGLASFTVTSQVPEDAKIGATIKSYRIDTAIHFRPALPHELLLTADKVVANTSQSITLNADLIRDPFKGSVTNPVKAFFVITPLSPQNFSLIYPNFGLSSQGKAAITVTNPFSLKGFFRAESKTLSANGDTLRRQLIFEYN
jgi:hypothetical protein